ncbi:hypothetical protein COCNU_15G005030 [Cocos nucifera]|uniref:Uncharacterized protein n=1 Tax=Cocos nucifera TaxID=13894 RepID=A0A8K0IX99_COCNU|nr:hypothetical protein COCNU_15G005030 [Cocos nucifera]
MNGQLSRIFLGLSPRGMRVSVESLHHAIKRKPASRPSRPSRGPSKKSREGSLPRVRSTQPSSPLRPPPEWSSSPPPVEAISTNNDVIIIEAPARHRSTWMVIECLLNSELEDKTQTTNAWAEVTGELLHATEKREKKYQEKIALLQAKLASSRDKSANLEIQQKKDKKEFEKLRVDFQKKMESVESTSMRKGLNGRKPKSLSKS